MVAQASNPEEQSLLIEAVEVVSGIPERNYPILAVKRPDPVYKTLPIIISLISAGLTPVYF